MRAGRISVFLVVAAAVVAAALWSASEPRPAFSTEDPGLNQEGDSVKGRLVFAAGACASCHAQTGQSDRLKLGGGLSLSSPFGTFRPPNYPKTRSTALGSGKSATSPMRC